MMLEMVKLVLQNRKGQGLVEYGLILALISIAAIGVMPGVGTQIETVFTSVKTALTAAP